MATRQRNDGRSQPQQVLIALMGETGGGKSSFARRITRNPEIRVNHGMTQEKSAAVMPYRFQIKSTDGRRRYNVTLLDCPGFDNIDVPDNDIINSILRYLRTTYEQQQTLHGIIYTLDITKPRVTNSALANISMFKRLVGDEYYRNVVLGTSFWDSLRDVAQGEAREAELTREDAFWGQLYREGSKVRRLAFDARPGELPHFVDDALSPIGTDEDVILQICEENQPLALCAQVEMDGGLETGETSAVVELNQWRDRARQHQALLREQLAANATRLGEALQHACLRMDEEYDQQAREFALDRQRLRESRRRVRLLVEQRARRAQNAPAPESEETRRLREQIRVQRQTREAAERADARKARKRCAFYQDCSKGVGMVQCNPICKRPDCKRRVKRGEKFYHCCFCLRDRHNFHQCLQCGDQCGRDHGRMLEFQVA